jgi:anti-anti-sigma factor
MAEMVVVLTGEFDMSNARQISDRVVGVLNDSASARIVLDLRGVTFLDCAGIRSILYAQGLAASAGRQLIVRHPAPFIAQTIRILDLAQRFYGKKTNQTPSAKT